MLSPGNGRGAHNKDNVNAQWNHVNVFLDNNDPPFICDHCGLEVPRAELLVHHRDDNHDNDDPSNLGAMHRNCHTSHHLKGKQLSEEHIHNLSIGHIGNRVSNAKLSEAEVLEIRAIYAVGGTTYKAIAKQYGVSEATIGCAVRGDLYDWAGK